MNYAKSFPRRIKGSLNYTSIIHEPQRADVMFYIQQQQKGEGLSKEN